METVAMYSIAVETLANATPGYLIWRVSMKWRAAVDRTLAPVGLTHAQYALLGSLYGLSRRGAEPSQRELAEFSGVEPIYVSKLARGLERAGLLVRAGNPSDPRAFRLTLTSHGTDVVTQAIALVRQLQEEMTAPLGGSDSRRTRELTSALRALLGDAPTQTRGRKP
jgi:DNA-binding MarR family transcriptional regulator